MEPRQPSERGLISRCQGHPFSLPVLCARSICYGIPAQSRFDAKGMAGNIIHAIATTNALVAGLITTEAVKLVLGQRDKCIDSSLFPNDDVKRIASFK